MKKIIFESERLQFREFDVIDAQDSFELNQNPEVLKYTGDRPFGTVAEAEEFLKGYNPYREFGMGRWAVLRKSDQAFLGWCGLKYRAEEETVDLGYRFKIQYWGMGYATEAGNACLKYGFDVLKLDRIIAQAMIENTASIRVLEKLGMAYVRDVETDLHGAVEYEIYT